MEAFSLLKYWKGGGSGGGEGVPVSTTHNTESGSGKTILAALANHPQTSCIDDDEEEEAGCGGDDGPFFDLEFALPDDEDDEEEEEVEGEEEEEEEVVLMEELQDEVAATGVKTRTTLECCRKSFVAERVVERKELNDVSQRDDDVIPLSSPSSSSCDSCCERSDPNLTLSPSGELFFHTEQVEQQQQQPSSTTPLVSESSDSSKPPPSSQIPAVSLLKSATKLRILMSSLKNISPKGQKPKQSCQEVPTQEKCQQQQPTKEGSNKGPNTRKFFTVKFKVEEVPIVSFFTSTKDNDDNNNSSIKPSNDTVSCSSSSSSSVEATTITTTTAAKPSTVTESHECLEETASHEENNKRNLARGEKVQKYLKMVKPLYIRVSKRYGEKLGLVSPANETTPKSTNKDSSDPSPQSVKVGELNTSETEEKISGGGGGSGGCNGGGTQKQAQQTGANLAVGFRVIRKRLGKSKSASSSTSSSSTTNSSSTTTTTTTTAGAVTTSKRRDDSLIQQQDGIQGAIMYCKRSLVHSSSDTTSAATEVEAEETSSSVLSRSVSGPLAT